MTPSLGTSLQLPVRRVVVDPDACADPAAWPAMVPAVRRLLSDGGLDLGPATVMVGENGSGKWTLVEAIAMACRHCPSRAAWRLSPWATCSWSGTTGASWPRRRPICAT